MKFILLALTFIWLIRADAQIVKGAIRQLEFDSLNNTFFNLNSYTFVKLDKDHRFQIQASFGAYLLKFLINKNDDVFVFNNADGNFNGTGSKWVWVHRFKANSRRDELLFYIFRHSKYLDFFIDKDDVIFLNTRDGVALFDSRKNKTLPVPVSNLEGYFYDTHAVDDVGNVYLTNSEDQNYLAIIKRSEKKKSTPSGVKYPVGEKSAGLTFWNGDLYFVTENNVKKFKNELFEPQSIESVFKLYETNFTLYNSLADRLLIFSRNEVVCSAYFLNSDGELITVKTITYCNILEYNKFAFKKDGTGYFFLNDQFEEGYKIIFLRGNETEFDEHIVIGEYVADIETDSNDNVWILTNNGTRGGLYVIRKGSDDPILTCQSNFDARAQSFLKYKEATGEVFVAAENGLYVYKNPSLPFC